MILIQLQLLAIFKKKTTILLTTSLSFLIAAKDDTPQRNCSKGSQKENKSGQKENLVSDFSLNHNQKSSHHKSKGNKQGSGGSTKRNEKNSFSHPWLASTLKGHTDDIRDIDFSSNGKYLASCGEGRLSYSNNNNQSHIIITIIIITQTNISLSRVGFGIRQYIYTIHTKLHKVKLSHMMFRVIS